MNKRLTQFLLFLLLLTSSFLLTNISATEKEDGGWLNTLGRQASIVGSLFNSQEGSLLAAEDSLATSVFKNDEHVLVEWDIKKGYYLYQKRLEFYVDGKVIEPVTFPPATQRSDPWFGDVLVYTEPMAIKFPIDLFKNAKELKVVFQGCADIGVCYPPLQKTFDLQKLFSQAKINQSVTQKTLTQPANANFFEVDNRIISETSFLKEKLIDGSWLVIIGLFFMAGLLLSLTPCFFPMIPILSGIIANEGSLISSKKSFYISLVYVMTMALTYAVAGVISGLLGANIQIALQNTWVLVFFAMLFVIFSFSMFGFYELKMPTSLQTKLAKLSNTQKEGTYWGAGMMGSLSALIVGPCAAPALASALLYIGQTGDGLLGGVALFSLGLGVGLPLLVYGTLGGKLLPKAGAWMKTINTIFGVLMLAASLYILDKVVPIWLSMLLWSSFFVILAVYMGVFESLQSTKNNQQNSKWRVLLKGVAWLFLLIGLMLLLGLASGGKSLLQPLKHLSVRDSTNNNSENKGGFFTTIASGSPLELALKFSKENQVPALFYVTAEWCITCKELDFLTFQDDRVMAFMRENKQLQVLRVDVTNHTVGDKSLYNKYQIIAPPAFVFFDSKGEEIENYRIVGFISAKDFLQRLKRWKNS